MIPDLESRLEATLGCFLNMAVEGSKNWFVKRLEENQPECVKIALKDYINENDKLQQLTAVVSLYKSLGGGWK